MDTLKLYRTNRKRSSTVSQTARSFVDFEVSGLSLYPEIHERQYDLISCLGWVSPMFDKISLSRLLSNNSGDMHDNRVALYVCPECVDPFCGGITTKVSVLPDVVIWDQFTFDNGWEAEPEMFQFYKLEGLGPYRFERSHYENTIRSFV